MKQLSHNDIQNQQQQFPITIVCDAIRTPENIGMCFRIAESFGVSKIYLHESSPATDNSNVKRTARNTVNQVAHSIDIQNFNFMNHEKIVLLLGSERNGIENIDHIDYSISIPMYGRNSSMNVIHSLGIALYEVTNQLK